MRAAKVLMVLPSLSVGGAERVASEMLNYWAAQQREVALLTLASSQQDHYELDARVTRTGLDSMWPSSNLWAGLSANWQRVRKLRAAITSHAPDVVVSFIDRTNLLVLAALLGSGIPVVVSERVDPRHRRLHPLRRLARRCLYPTAAAVVVQTKSIAAWAARLCPQHKLRVIENPVTEMPAPSVFTTRQTKAVAIGRLTHQKGFDLLLHAFAGSQMATMGWTLEILGEGPERRNLEALIQTLELANQVQLSGTVSEPWRHLDQARIFLLPSRFEGFPNALLEAMAMGCACIATDCDSGPAEIIESGRNGLLVPVDDVPSLIAAMDQLTNDTTLAQTLAAHAPQVRERFATAPIMQMWDTLLDNVITR